MIARRKMSRIRTKRKAVAYRALRAPDPIAQRAADWAAQYSAKELEGSSALKASVRSAVSEALRRDSGPDTLARSLQRILPLSPGQEEAVSAFKEQLRSAQEGTVVSRAGISVKAPKGGFSEARVGAWAKKYEKALRSARAEMVAEYEMRQAVEQAKRELWQEEYGASTLRIWQDNGDACPTVCADMVGETARVDDVFELPDGTEVDGPPAHPFCDCDTVLFRERRLGGAGSGNFGHGGRPGEVGGSAPGGGGAAGPGPRTRLRVERQERHKEQQRIYHKERYHRLKAEKKAEKEAAQRQAPEPPKPLPAAPPHAQPPAPAVAPPAPGLSPEEQKVASGHVSGQESLGGGVNETYIVKFADGSKGVFKPDVGENPMPMRPGINDMGANREAAAYEVAKLGGAGALVPVTVIRTVNGERGSVQQFVPDAEVAGLAPARAYGSHDDLGRAAMFDYIIGNQDRHNGNWMLDKAGGIHLIDHGLAFGTKDKSKWINAGNNQFLKRAADYMHSKPPTAFVEHYVRNKEAIRDKLTSMGIPKPAVDRVMLRISNAASGQTWEGLFLNRT